MRDDVPIPVAAGDPHHPAGARAPRDSSAATGRRGAPDVRDDSVPAPLARVLRTVRRIIGVPDYERYVRHMAECHPEQRVMSEREFVEERLRDKYSRPGQRCC
jgi:uncharacterized short protein YbdD (DUF466 family)